MSPQQPNNTKCDKERDIQNSKSLVAFSLQMSVEYSLMIIPKSHTH